MRPNPRLSIVLMVVALVVISPMASADRWYEHYARAEAALDREDHERAIEELTRALERRGDSGARVRTYGMRATAYFPYLKLGVAYFQAAEYEAALRAFDTEERLGAIQESEEASAELARYRQLAADALERRRIDQRRAFDDIVQQSLADARTLQSNGRLGEALAAVGRALSLTPEDPAANELASALRTELNQQNEARVRRERASQLLEEGTRLRSAGQLAEAASRFRQAADLDPESGARALLAGVQAELAHQTEVPSPNETTEILTRVVVLMSADELDEALALVQEVIAAVPDSREAVDLERNILARIDQENRTAETGRLLVEAKNRLADGDQEGAITAANLVLARDPGHPEALGLITQAYTGLSRRLLGAGSAQNLPPAIRFADMRQEDSDGLLVQVVGDRDFRLSGVVIDDSKATVTVSDDTGLDISIELSDQGVGGVVITEFRFGAQLPVGVTTFHVSATDRNGLSSGSEYTVRYRRPLLRSPWLWAALIAIAVLLSGIVAGRRFLERRRLLLRRFNPFVAGPPVLDPNLFFGRDALLDRVLATVPNNSLLLLGERRIGKTSLLHQLRLRLQEFESGGFYFVPVYVDLQGTPEHGFFSTLAEAVGEAIKDPRMAAARADNNYDSHQLVRDLRRAIPTIDCPESKRVKLVLLIDEIDELNGYSYRTNQKLRGLFMRGFADQLVAVAAGVGIARQWEHEGSPWYNFFEELEVGPVDLPAAKLLVTKPLNGVIAIDDEAVELLVRTIGGRPYLLQKTALSVVQKLHEEGRSRITVADIEAAFNDGWRRVPASEGEDS